MNKRQIGKTGEQMAADYLVRNGFTILEKNFRSGRFGEIDIIAEEDSYLCFVEVKMRTSTFRSTFRSCGQQKRQN